MAHWTTFDIDGEVTGSGHVSKSRLFNFNSKFPSLIYDELYKDVGANGFILGDTKRAFLATDFYIETDDSGGTILEEGTDYQLIDEDFNYTEEVGATVYTRVQILNAAYQTGPLYISYKCCGSYTDVDMINSINSGFPTSTLSFYITDKWTNRICYQGSFIIVPAFSVILDGQSYYTTMDTSLSVADLDTGSSFTFGADHYIWAGEPASGKTPVIKISLSSTSPAGITNGKLIGGFHYGKIRNSFTVSDVSDGIVSASVWDLQHMPSCYVLGLDDPSTYQIGGMIEVIPGSLWADIYLASDGGGTLPYKRVYSKINQIPLSGTEGLNWYDFVARGRAVGKRLLYYHEWLSVAQGSPQGIDGSNANGWTKTSNTSRVKTGATSSGDADSDYINAYNTSLLGARDCVGNLWEWLADMSNRHDSTSWAWQNVLDAGELSASNNFGQAYLPNSYGVVSYIAGGSWGDGVLAGSRAVLVSDFPWHVYTCFGARFACGSL